MKLSLLLVVMITLTALALGGETKKPTSQDILVAATLILEAGGETDPRAMRAVHEVIVNRSINRNLNQGQVVLQRLQFSCWNDKDRRVELLNHAVDHPKFHDALKIAMNPPSNFTDGATHYHAVRVNPYWAKSLKKTIQIENHIFYK